MAKNIKLIVYPVKDIAAAKIFFSKYLGVEPYIDSPYYLGFKTNDHEVGLDPNAQSPLPIGYIDVNSIKQYLQDLLTAGATIVQDVKDVGGGLQTAKVKDKNGNILGLRQSPSSNP